MQDRYTGDIGDFGKYGLLRVLTRANGEDEPLGLGVVWYLTPGEMNRDGQQRDYLQSGHRAGELLRRCDSGLHLRMTGFEIPQNQNVMEVRMREVLPEGTEFHEETLDPRAVRRSRGERVIPAREREREAWHRRAMERTEGCGLIFLDPDNGLAPQNVAPGSLRANKYAFHQEVGDYLDRGQSVVVYQHLNRSAAAIRQIHQRQLEIFTKIQRRALVLRYHRGSPRTFILIPQAKHRDGLTGRVRRMMEGPWSRHFSMIG